MDLQLLLDLAAAYDPTRVVVVDSAGVALTTGRLRELASVAAATFRATGASHVAYLGPNAASFPVALLGAGMAGLPFVPLNYRLADAQLAQVIGDHDLVAVAAGDHAARLVALGVPGVLDPSRLLDPEPASPGVTAVIPPAPPRRRRLRSCATGTWPPT